MKSLRACYLLGFILCAAAAHADVLTGRVVAISDGDTLTVLDSMATRHRVRLTGIDAPEKAQPFGAAAKKSLSDLAFNRQVRIEFTKKDKYGRLVGKVFAGDQDVCLEQIRRGLAWHYKQYEREQSVEDRRNYAEVESQARSQGLGLWIDREPVPPWEWRRGTRR